MSLIETKHLIDLPPGATYLPEFISPAEEQDFASRLDQGVWSTELSRRVQHHGFYYDYRAREVARGSYLGPLPNWLEVLAKRLVEMGYFSSQPDQTIANEYLPGQGISAHVDCTPCFKETIASISLLAPCDMVFRHKPTASIKTDHS